MSDLYGKNLILQKNALIVIYVLGLVSLFALGETYTSALTIVPLVASVFGVIMAKKENVPFARIHYAWILRTFIATWGWIFIVLFSGIFIIYFLGIPFPDIIDMDVMFEDPIYDDFWFNFAIVFLLAVVPPNIWYCYRFIRGLAAVHRDRTPKGKAITEMK